MIKPTEDRIAIKPIPMSEYSEGGVYRGTPMTTFVADKSKTQQVTTGKVMAIGPGKYNKKGYRRAPDVPIGAIVCFSDTCGSRIDDELILIREDDVIGFMEQPKDVEILYDS
ncbi:MAG: hypothetical protein KJO69_07340 [Gammaproteobacteria bacterium]|nr:hypothetical protein [Gammaproteobacteria bacterium]